MKKTILRLCVAAGTFFFGVGIFILVFSFLNPMPDIASPEFSTETEEFVHSDCYKTDFPGLSKKISEIKKGKSPYFPKRIWGNDMSPKHSVAGWYSRHLRAMEEKSLLDIADTETETYRFLWLRTFHHPIFVRIERKRNDIRLFTKELDGAGGYEPGKILRSHEIVLNQDDFDEFLVRLEKAGYWNLLTDDDDEDGFDGSQWIIEGVKDGRYHLVKRWSPTTGEYRQAGLYLLKLSGIDADRLQDDLY